MIQWMDVIVTCYCPWCTLVICTGLCPIRGWPRLIWALISAAVNHGQTALGEVVYLILIYGQDGGRAVCMRKNPAPKSGVQL